jgi:hypothetical protein
VTADLERDLGAWAAGALSRERLLATHGADAAGTVAVHERLAEVAAGMPVPDPDAGWAALVAMIEAPAPVVRLRRPARRRTVVSLLVAAAIVAAGSAFAAIRASSHAHPPSGTASSVGVIPRSGPVFGPGDRSLVPPPTTSETSGPPRTHRPSHGGTSSGGDAGGSTGSDGIPATDDPHDRDHGTGNDGSHNDRGGGNDGSSGTLPHESHGGGH